MGTAARPVRLTLVLAALVVLQGLALPAALHYGLRTPKEETVVFQAEEFLKRSQREDSWKPLEVARAFVDSRPGARLYEDVFFARQIKFQYPPSSLLFVDHASRSTLNWVSWIAVGITALLCWMLLDRSLVQHAPGWRPMHPAHRAMQAALVVAVTLTYYPIVKAYTLGQIQTVLTAACAGILVLVATDRSIGGGVLAGLAALVKPTYAALVLWALARRQWRFAAGLIVTVAAGVVVSSAAFGVVQWADYTRVLSFIAQRGEAFYANQSVNGLLNRLVGNGPVLEWQRDQFAPYDPVVRWLTLLSAVLLMLVALWYRRVVRSSMPECDAAAFLIAVTAGAPIAWEHHYGVLLPIAALATGPAIATDRHATRTGLLIVAVLISGQYLTVTHATASTPWSIAMSYTLAAALLLLGVLLSLPPNLPDISASSRDR